ncbi:probable UDP-N-acetylglucosamine--peptide N-acetylglucosaminyltransferase SPINDLY isoform X3 [Zingiber officinale]|uniref:probable UDP-N-acetylglucosamine--peptide N-acetylglucosaminyltransferase SPINDLY isoform X3 n=1 Tax=Zingiber officinale TaxID=94328 RepID=UPI001C4BB98F|nr:probable UDP-N-acetylglucosamine--peptide N-acetylglucosaminyltransferase SPINDLY isoform X3 [Zingiber officinale]XP_042439092.1 probable UDP-N-acetylglucosamine--peptide N-acetylglucosaminyltransferase SPINDLY isoform X3 [Zingiber officinale]
MARLSDGGGGRKWVQIWSRSIAAPRSRLDCASLRCKGARGAPRRAPGEQRPPRAGRSVFPRALRALRLGRASGAPLTTQAEGLVHMARKMPKNAHAHFLLGLMYQRMGQPQKAILAFEKSAEILQKDEEEVQRPDLLSLVLIHHAQCFLLANSADNSEREFEMDELEEILKKLKCSIESDTKQAAFWNMLGLILLRTGRLQSAISVLSSLITIIPDYLDALANLGIAYLQSGNLKLSAKCFQDLLLKDQNHPAALMNHAILLLCKYAPVIPGPGANAGQGAFLQQIEAATVAKECLLATLKSDLRSGTIWVNLANAYYVLGDHRSAKQCLEKAGTLEPNNMSTRYAIATHRIKDALRSLGSREQLTWAANEMASILKEGDAAVTDLPVAWAGLAMAYKAQHEIAAAFYTEQTDLDEADELALCTLKRAIEVDADDAVQWHQLGLYSLGSMQFNTSVKFLKAAVARSRECSYAWSNLGIALQLSDDLPTAELTYKRALSLATNQQAHAILSNLGNLYRRQKRFKDAKAMFSKSLELCPGYAPAYNNLGLVHVAECLWEEAKSCFEKALHSDPLLDSAKSNMTKTDAMTKLHEKR